MLLNVCPAMANEGRRGCSGVHFCYALLAVTMVLAWPSTPSYAKNCRSEYITKLYKSCVHPSHSPIYKHGACPIFKECRRELARYRKEGDSDTRLDETKNDWLHIESEFTGIAFDSKTCDDEGKNCRNDFNFQSQSSANGICTSITRHSARMYIECPEPKSGPPEYIDRIMACFGKYNSDRISFDSVIEQKLKEKLNLDRLTFPHSGWPEYSLVKVGPPPNVFGDGPIIVWSRARLAAKLQYQSPLARRNAASKNTNNVETNLLALKPIRASEPPTADTM
jgi:hypothetical protein